MKALFSQITQRVPHIPEFMEDNSVFLHICPGYITLVQTGFKLWNFIFSFFISLKSKNCIYWQVLNIPMLKVVFNIISHAGMAWYGMVWYGQ